MNYPNTPHIFEENALRRPQKTLRAATIPTEKATEIAQLYAKAGEREVVVAVVNPDLAFGVRTIPRRELVDYIVDLPEHSWSITFGPQTTIEEVRLRCSTMAELAQKRFKLLSHRQAR